MMIRAAFIQGENRFWLLRDWDGRRRAKTLTLVMLNPSKADGERDDPTIRKGIGFGVKLGYGRMCVLNLFPRRATDPSELRFGVGQLTLNLVHVRARLEDSDAVVFAWGASIRHAPEPARQQALSGLAAITEALDIEPWCFGVSKDGHPRHPLMLSYATKLEVWPGYDAPEWRFLRVA